MKKIHSNNDTGTSVKCPESDTIGIEKNYLMFLAHNDGFGTSNYYIILLPKESRYRWLSFTDHKFMQLQIWM